MKVTPPPWFELDPAAIHTISHLPSLWRVLLLPRLTACLPCTRL